MARILLVEDDEFFAVAVREMIESEGHEVTWAENGKVAIEKCENQTFECVISDLQMPVMNGNQLAAWLKANRPWPLIIMTGYADNIDTRTALELGAKNLVFKPFSEEEMLAALSQTLASTSTELNPSQPSYARIPSSALMQAGMAEFNLYTDSENGFVKLVSRGEMFDPIALGIEEIKYLFTEYENLARAAKLAFVSSRAIAKSGSVDPAVKAKIVQDCLEIVFQKVGAMGADKDCLQGSIDLLACYLSSFDDRSAWHLIDNLEQNSQILFTHALAVTSLSVMLAHVRNMSIEECFKLMTACLFHDIGKTRLDPRLLESPRALLNMRDRQALQKHVDLGVEILKKGGVVSDEVCEIVAQHHESCQGTGYPLGLKKNKIHPIARIIRLVDEFCNGVVRSPGHPGIPPYRMLEKMSKMDELDQELVWAFSKILEKRD